MSGRDSEFLGGDRVVTCTFLLASFRAMQLYFTVSSYQPRCYPGTSIPDLSPLSSLRAYRPSPTGTRPTIILAAKQYQNQQKLPKAVVGSRVTGNF
eukprot:1011616-Rhodomonas_salina.4